MKSSKKQKVHTKWLTVGQENGSFVYRCQRCGCTTLNGEPLPKPYDQECPEGGKK